MEGRKKESRYFCFLLLPRLSCCFQAFVSVTQRVKKKKKTKKNNKKDIKARRPKNKHGTRSCVCHLGDGTGRDIEKNNW